MAKDKKISIIIPIYNQAKFIARCLRSLCNQSFNINQFEIIIINDGSDDDPLKEIKPFMGQALDIIFLSNEINKGLPFSANKGILKASSDYIIRVDADDYVNKDFLLFLYNELQGNRTIDALACDYIMVDDDEKFLETRNCLDYPIACGILFKKANLLDINLYDENFYCHEDKELRIRFEKKFIIGRLDNPLYRYRRHAASLTNNENISNKYDKILKEKHPLEINPK